VRGYAYFTLPANRTLRDTAERRLQVIQSLDSLGAGFQLASHDLDIRGAGNLLGDEQSGHVREVGFELYNHLLEEAVLQAKQQAESDGQDEVAADWSPQISIDAAALMPESYIGDIDLRLTLYRRLAALETADDIEAFAAELIDRFGSLPEETENLLKLVAIKQLCRKANVAKVDAGPRGIVLAFHENRFARPERLVPYIADHSRMIRVRADHRLVIMHPTTSPLDRLKQVRGIVDDLAKLAA
jgi:transcription-repair coupling factor (superfamily II helicase)